MLKILSQGIERIVVEVLGESSEYSENFSFPVAPDVVFKLNYPHLPLRIPPLGRDLASNGMIKKLHLPANFI